MILNIKDNPKSACNMHNNDVFTIDIRTHPQITEVLSI